MLCGREKLDIRHKLSVIQSAMGVCSQDNLLWDDLTGTEHLSFFCRIRQVRERRKHIEYWLKRVNLFSGSDRRKRSKAYSGGMKRRLSVACSFIGNPRLVYLDEPSTGLDPASRRRLWRVITEFKQRASEGSGVVLTTHSMEEAEVLCDRIAIMSEGRLRCIGHGADIKRRFGEAYKLTIHTASHSDAAAEAVRAFVVSQLAADARPLNASMGGTTDFEMPRASITHAQHRPCSSTSRRGIRTGRGRRHERRSGDLCSWMRAILPDDGFGREITCPRVK